MCLRLKSPRPSSRPSANQSAYIHCASANVRGGDVVHQRVRLDGWDVDRALKNADMIGLRATNLKEFALDSRDR